MRLARTASTASSIGAVSRPVKVFCWLGWYVPRSAYGPTADLGAVPEPRPRRDDVAARRQDPERRVPGERPERDDHPDIGQQGQLPDEIRHAAIALIERRLVGRRGAADGRRDVGTAERQSVVGADGGRAVGEARRVEGGPAGSRPSDRR